MKFQVVGGSFEDHSPFVVLNDHFIDGNSADDIIADELNKYFRCWILVVNENDPTINSLVHATNYEYKNKGGTARKLIVRFDKEYAGIETKPLTPPSFDNLNDVTIKEKEDGWFEFMRDDVIYMLTAKDETKPVERVRWYRKGKLHEMKTFEQFVSDIDPYGEERWEDDSDYRDISNEDLSVQRQLLSGWIFEDNSVDFYYTELNRDTFDAEHGIIINVNEGPGHAENFPIMNVMLDEDGNILFHTIMPEYIDEDWFDFDFWITVDRNHEIVIHAKDAKTITVKI